jgi:hypothetical protein
MLETLKHSTKQIETLLGIPLLHALRYWLDLLSYRLDQTDALLRTPWFRTIYLVGAFLHLVLKIAEGQFGFVYSALLLFLGVALNVAVYKASYKFFDPLLDSLMGSSLVERMVKITATLTILSAASTFRFFVFALVVLLVCATATATGNLLSKLWVTYLPYIKLIGWMTSDSETIQEIPALLIRPSRKQGAYLLHATTQILLIRH